MKATMPEATGFFASDLTPNSIITTEYSCRHSIIFLIKTSPFLYIANERFILHYESVARTDKSGLFQTGSRISARVGIFHASPVHKYLTSGYCCRESMRARFHFQSLGILAALIVMVVTLTLASPHFLTTENIFSVIRSFSFVAIMAIGETLTIITGGIDLSVGSVLGLCSCLTALCFQTGYSVPIGLTVGLLSGLIIGFLNGQLITRLELPPFIVTLGMLSMARGLAYVISKGWPISGLPESYMRLGQGYLWVIPLPVIVMVIFAVIAAVFLNRSVIGRQIYAIGGNEMAARLSGVPVDRVKLIAYTISSFAAALAGILLVARLGVAQSIGGQGYELDAIAASVIGGTSLMGGEGTVSGVIIGAAIMGVLRNGLVLLGVSAFWQQFALGAIIVLAVAFDKMRK